MAKRILIVDDSVTILRAVGMALAGEDFSVGVARTIDEGLADAKKAPPDLIVADLALAGGRTGYDACAAFKANPALARVPVYILASKHNVYDEGRGRQAGAAGAWQKPFESKGLLDLLTQALGAPAAAEARRDTMEVPLADVVEMEAEEDLYEDFEVERPGGAPAPQPAKPAPAPAARPAVSIPVATVPAPSVERATDPMPVPSFAAAAPAAAPAPVSVPAAARTPAGLRPSLIPGASTPVARIPLAPGPAAPATPAPVPVASPPAARETARAPSAIAERVAEQVADRVAEKVAAAGARGPEYEAIAKLSREVIEQVVWEVVPELAEAIIRQEVDRLAAAKQ